MDNQLLTLGLILVGYIFVNNVVLAQFLGICPFLGVSRSVQTSLGMSGAVVFVMVLATTVTWLLQQGMTALSSALWGTPGNLDFLRTILFILVIAALVQMVEIILKKVAPPLYQALGIFLPLITTNCAVLGIALLTIQKQFNLVEGVTYAAAIALGFGLALVIFAGIREQLELADIPKPLKGAPISLITAGLLSLAFFGFSGMVPAL